MILTKFTQAGVSALGFEVEAGSRDPTLIPCDSRVMCRRMRCSREGMDGRLGGGEGEPRLGLGR